MADPNLSTLDYPRHVHQPQGAVSKIVCDAAECAAALKDGWVLKYTSDDEARAAAAKAAPVTAAHAPAVSPLSTPSAHTSPPKPRVS